MPSLISLIVFIFSLNEKLLLFVATYDGVVSIYEVNTTDGGECPKIRSQYLLGNVSVKGQSTATNIRQDKVGKFIIKDLHILIFILFVTVR